MSRRPLLHAPTPSPRRLPGCLAASAMLMLVAWCSTLAIAQPTRVIFVQPIQVGDDAGSDYANPGRELFEAATDKIYAQAGIDIKFLPWNTYNNASFQNITTTAQFNSLISTSGHGQNASSSVCNMWFTKTLSLDDDGTASVLGLGTINGNGTAIANQAINNNELVVLAHELGHNFGLRHTNFGAGGTQNFMTDGGTQVHVHNIGDITPDGMILAQMTQQQIDRFLGNSTVKTIYTSTFNGPTTGQFAWGNTFNWDNTPSITAFPNLDVDKGIFNAVVNFGGVYLNQNIIIEKYTQNGGIVSTINGSTQGPASTLQIDDTFTWTSGTQAGLGVTSVAKMLKMSTAAGTQGPQLSSGRTLRMLSGCEGTLTGGNLVGSGSALLELQEDSNLEVTNSANFQRLSGTPVIQNAGRIALDAGIDSVQWRLNNNGEFLVRTNGLAQLSGGGSGTGIFFVSKSAEIDFRSSFTCGNVSGNGTVDFSSGTTTITADYILDPTMQPDNAGWTNVKGGKVQFNGAAVVGKALNLTAGVASFANATTIPRLYLSGSAISDEVFAPNGLTVTTEMKWDGPIISGSGVKTINAPLELKSGVLSGGTLRTTGATSFIGTGPVYGAKSAVWQNDGDFNLQGDYSFNVLPPDIGTNPPPPSFSNRGTLIKSAGAGTATFDWPMSNSGTLKVQSGRLFFTGGYSQSAGNTNVGQGAVLESSLAVALTGGSLSGKGTFKAPNLMNNGIIAPGDSAGRLTLDGAFAEGAAGSLAIELGGTGAGTSYDQFAVTGNTTLGGTLDVMLINGWTPNPGDAYTILTGASVAGTFTNTPGNIYTFAGGQFNVLYNPGSVVLTNFAAVPEPLGAAIALVCVGCISLRRRR
jgi:hypothetical protein